MFPDGSVAGTGEISEIDPPRRIVIAWRNEFSPELGAEGFPRMSCAPEPRGEAVRLTISHEMDREKSKFIAAVCDGWPRVLSSSKSFLETGEPLTDTRVLPKGA